MDKAKLIGLLILALMLLAACGGGDAEVRANSSGADAAAEAVVSSGDPQAGEAKFNEVCIACHGAGGVGVEGLGKPFTTSEFVHGQTDEALLAFIKTGRPIGDPANTT
ncbi:MAG: c-type cytochrome, partial [Anaerolineales bacterium]|nr:c-type cytochrome [Anaerolineales bacterium]